MHPSPRPVPRPSEVPKANVRPPPPIPARPRSAASKISHHEPIKAHGGITPIKRPASANAGATNRSASHSICSFQTYKFYFPVDHKRKD